MGAREVLNGLVVVQLMVALLCTATGVRGGLRQGRPGIGLGLGLRSGRPLRLELGPGLRPGLPRTHRGERIEGHLLDEGQESRRRYP